MHKRLTFSADPATDTDEGLVAQLFVRKIDLPTASAATARAAVKLQLDRLSPLDPASVEFSVVPTRAVAGDQTRYAVAICSREDLGRVGPPVEQRGGWYTFRRVVDGETLAFRFRDPRPVGLLPTVPGGWIRPLTLAAGCSALIFLGLSQRLSVEANAARSELTAATELAESAARDRSVRDATQSRWRATTGQRQARLIVCALSGIAKASDGPTSIERLTLANGVVEVVFSDQAAALRAASVMALRSGATARVISVRGDECR